MHRPHRPARQTGLLQGPLVRAEQAFVLPSQAVEPGGLRHRQPAGVDVGQQPDVDPTLGGLAPASAADPDQPQPQRRPLGPAGRARPIAHVPLPERARVDAPVDEEAGLRRHPDQERGPRIEDRGGQVVAVVTGVGDDQGLLGQGRQEPPEVVAFAGVPFAQLPAPGHAGRQVDHGGDPQRRRASGLAGPPQAGRRFVVATTLQTRAVATQGDEAAMDQVVAQRRGQASAKGRGQGGQGPHGQAAEGLLEPLGGPAGATPLGSTDRDDPASHLEPLGRAVAQRPGHGQEDQDQVVEVPTDVLALLLETASGSLPDLRGEKLPQAKGHRASVPRRASRDRFPCHKSLLSIGLGVISRFNGERLVLSHVRKNPSGFFRHCVAPMSTRFG